MDNVTNRFFSRRKISQSSRNNHICYYFNVYCNPYQILPRYQIDHTVFLLEVLLVVTPFIVLIRRV